MNPLIVHISLSSIVCSILLSSGGGRIQLDYIHDGIRMRMTVGSEITPYHAQIISELALKADHSHIIIKAAAIGLAPLFSRDNDNDAMMARIKVPV